MICVSIGRGRHRMMKAEHKHLAEQGVKLVELRLDYIRRSVNLKRLLSDRPCPAIATCRRAQEGGKWERTENDRLVLLRSAIADKVDYVDLEHDIADKIPRYGSTKRIISYHNFHETPANLEEIHESLLKLDPDIIKIATMANHPCDSLQALRLCRDAKVPTVAFCMGEMGIPSRVLCGKFGSPMTYATFHQDRQFAPGQLSYTQMNEDYRYEQIGPDTEILGVVADPVAHSLSPRVHNALIIDSKMDMIYLPFRVPAESLEPFMNQCYEIGVRGLSITLPHKERVLKCITALDDNVAGIRAANTVVFREHNAFGYNTDCDAAMQSLRRAIEKEDEEHPFADMRAMILGAGGVAKALAFGFKRGGGKVTICARDFRKGESLAGHVGCQWIDWPKRQNHECNVVINATPVGMHPNLNDTPFETEWFHRHMVAFDTVYNPEQTLFIKNARQAGCWKVITGVDMFVGQAARQFQLFTGTEPNVGLIRDEVKRAISAARY